ncbi:histone [Lichtheimia corymbifera JMRC:FSU:9682]|uniref:Histone acetyltransferase n=1 Tax=Lichtheimia corymbifera JMRC:FSU:9682 TaxID=1263082 RepID=A0A068RLF3_9FUNG|nr:histone [Lichtheimia corymbifera JMRC:FSU:9682]
MPMITRGRKRKSTSDDESNALTPSKPSSKRRIIASTSPWRSSRVAATATPTPTPTPNKPTNTTATTVKPKKKTGSTTIRIPPRQQQQQLQPKQQLDTASKSSETARFQVNEERHKKRVKGVHTKRGHSTSSKHSEQQQQRKRKRQQDNDKEHHSSSTQDDSDKILRTFGNKLTEAEAKTKRGTPTDTDKHRFDRSSNVMSKIHQNAESAPTDMPKIEKIRIGNYLIKTWFVAPYPEEYSQYPTLFFCEFCLKYMHSEFVAGRHKRKCPFRHPPGDEIYRDGAISIFEVDGRKNKIYCQNLCLLGKMFIDHKTLYYDVEPFLFYVMTEVDDTGCHLVGYFSKEKRSVMNYNVSCILTLPVHQRKGYGQYLIDFSYLLTKKEETTGSPEKPLSNLGLLSYRKYWKTTIFKELDRQDTPVSIEELSHRTAMTVDDVITTLELLGMLKEKNETNQYYLQVDHDIIRQHLKQIDHRGYPEVDPVKLTWTPYALSRDRLAALTNPETTTTTTTTTTPAQSSNEPTPR